MGYEMLVCVALISFCRATTTFTKCFGHIKHRIRITHTRTHAAQHIMRVCVWWLRVPYEQEHATLLCVAKMCFCKY